MKRIKNTERNISKTPIKTYQKHRMKRVKKQDFLA